MSFEIAFSPYNNVPTLEDIKKKFPHLTCFLFDMDGTLIDTERLHAIAINKVLNSIGNSEFTDEDIHYKFIGLPDNEVYKTLSLSISFNEFLDQKNKYLIEIFKSTNLKEYLAPGITSLLNDLKNSNIKLGLVTASERIITDYTLKNADLLKFFDIVVTREDTTRSKPNNDPYLFAMNSLKSTPSETLVFEDSIHGLSAAQSARVSGIIKANWFI